VLKGTLKMVHIYLNYTLLVLVIMHVLAALKHQFVDRDGLLARMLPFLR
jgi:cytochrome b561